MSSAPPRSALGRPPVRAPSTAPAVRSGVPASAVIRVDAIRNAEILEREIFGRARDGAAPSDATDPATLRGAWRSRLPLHPPSPVDRIVAAGRMRRASGCRYRRC